VLDVQSLGYLQLGQELHCDRGVMAVSLKLKNKLALTRHVPLAQRNVFFGLFQVSLQKRTVHLIPASSVLLQAAAQPELRSPIGKLVEPRSYLEQCCPCRCVAEPFGSAPCFLGAFSPCLRVVVKVRPWVPSRHRFAADFSVGIGTARTTARAAAAVV
jgi:hypothetical protein